MKNVTRARLDVGPSGSAPNRALSILERATYWGHPGGGVISPEEDGRNVFMAALYHGDYTVNWNIHMGTRQQFRTRDFRVAVYLAARLIMEGARPLMYATTYNRYSLLSARSYRDEHGKWVRVNSAIADEWQELLDIWCAELGIKNDPAPILTKLKSFIQREQLEWPKRNAKQKLSTKSRTSGKANLKRERL